MLVHCNPSVRLTSSSNVDMHCNGYVMFGKKSCGSRVNVVFINCNELRDGVTISFYFLLVIPFFILVYLLIANYRANYH